MLPSQINENRISVSVIKWIKLKLKQKDILIIKNDKRTTKLLNHKLK